MTADKPSGGPVERDSAAARLRPRGVGADLLLLGAGLSWASVWAASWLAAPLCLATRRRDRTVDGRDAGDDLLAI